MNNKNGPIALVIAVIALCISILNLVAKPKAAAPAAASPEKEDIQYVMYVGTNNKDSNQPDYDPEESKKRAQDILIRHFGGYTIQEANGGWEDNGVLYQEYTMVIYLSDTNLDAVHAAADDMIKEFSQSSILIQENKTTTEFYSGAN
ncbi:MAG: hypothetical protein IKD66_14685 [Solobacterium sp.]|nr:hypothetical protein [Solobacterium sp.]